MPGGDGTGPMGAGPRTGRNAGICAGFAGPGSANFAGVGIGRGRRGGMCGGGRGNRNRFYATGVPGWATAQPLSPEQEAEYLDRQIEAMEKDLEAVRGRRGELSEKK